MKVLLGKRVHSIQMIPTNIYKSSSCEQLMADEIRIDFGDQLLSILPVANTDELDIQVMEPSTAIQNKSFQSIFEEYTNLKLSYTWKAENTNGYMDVFIMAFNYLTPNILILCEGSTLKLFEIEPAIGTVS